MIRWTLLTVTLLAIALPAGADGRRRAVAPAPEVALEFTFDAGFRVVGATNPQPGVDSVTGQVHLYYVDHATGQPRVAVSSDGLSFPAGTSAVNVFRNDARNTRLPDGTWRRFQWNFGTSQFGSLFSPDGITFTPESGVRYTLQPADKGTLGVYDAFSDRQGGVVLLYLGDLPGLNNVRRAYSRDNGLSFTFDRGNVLGDDTAGGGANSFVDEKSIRLPDGRIRLFTMRQNTIYSFVSNDDGYSFVRDPGIRLERASFKEATLTSLNDPVVVRLPDGRFRMYVASLRSDQVWVVVSATTR
jgi:hypothetical protein